MRLLLCIFFLTTALIVQGQDFTLEELEADVYQYTELEEALQEPDSVFSLKLKSRLRKVPEEVFTAFPNLQYLDLSKNRLRELSPDIGKLKKLKKLVLFRNKLEELPPAIGELSELEELIANRNELYGLPEEVGELKKLRYIDLWSNNIGALPGSMAEMYALQEVDLRVIVITDMERQQINDLLPHVKVHMDEGCNCGK